MSKWVVACSLSLGLLFCTTAYAEEDDTMMIVEEGVEPEDIVKVITLPEFAAPKANEQARSGLGVAEDAKALGSELGQQIAEEAQSKGETMREEVRENVSNGVRRNEGRGRGRD